MAKYLLINIFFSFLLSNVIKDIRIYGNIITRDDTILKTISHSVNDTINIQNLTLDQQKLFDTGLFYDTVIYFDSTIYNIIVFEKPKRSISPEIDKDDILGWSAGISAKNNNINGKNKKLGVSLLAGANNLFELDYLDPKLKSTKDSLNINIYLKQTDNSPENYKLFNSGIQTSIALLTSNFSHQIKIINEAEFSKLNYYENTAEKNYSFINSFIYEFRAIKNKFFINLSHNYFNNIYDDYFSLKVNNLHFIDFGKINENLKLVINNKLYLNFSKNIPIYKKEYVINENYVRGYDINNLPFDMLENTLLWNNIVSTSIQLELPIKKTNLMLTNMLFFWDWGIGSNDIKKFNYKNKIKSYGLGFRYNIEKMGNIDICFGINPFNSKKEIQAIVNFKSF